MEEVCVMSVHLNTNASLQLEKTHFLSGFYNADPFNEMKPLTYAHPFIEAVSKGIFAGMSKDPQATW